MIDPTQAPLYPSKEVIQKALVNYAQQPEILNAENLKRAAVLIPLVVEQNNWSLIFIRRSDTVHDHKGQVAFPGGSVEPQDTDIIATALRETYEEIGVKSENVEVLGTLPSFATITKYLITPVVGFVSNLEPFILQNEEVSRVFLIPLSWLADPFNYEEKPFTQPGSNVENVIIYKPFDGEILWGATARMMHQILQILGMR